MRIGINGLYLLPGEVGGTETYLRNLLSALEKVDKENEYIVFTNRENHDTFTFQSKNFKKHLCSISSKSKWFRVVWEQLWFPFIREMKSIDVLFSPGYVAPVLSRKKHVVAIHDMLYKRYPNLVSRAKLVFWGVFVPLSVRKAQHIITFSEFSKTDIVRFLGADPERVTVTYAGINHYFPTEITTDVEAQVKEKYGINGSFILSVATLSPHKNLSGLLRAFSILRAQFQVETKLLLAGKNERSTDELNSVIAKLGLQRDVRLLGYVPTDDLAALYRLADCFVLPSLMEGFGYPVLEAMQMGCAVVCSNSASLPEVAGDAAIFFDPLNLDEMASSIDALLSDKELREEYRRKGRENIRRFSWEKTARETLHVLLAAKGAL